MKTLVQRRTEAFALAEVLIAMGVVALSLAGVLTLSNQTLRIVGDMKNEQRALRVAESEMERIQAMGWRQLMALGPRSTLTSAAYPALSELSKGEGEVLITVVPGLQATDEIRTVSVRVAWVSREGRRREVTLATFVSPQEGTIP